MAIYNKHSNIPLKEVWLLHDSSSHGGVAIRNRVFADLGKQEVIEIATEIADAYDGFRKIIREFVENFISEELKKGETQILIEPDDGDSTEFFIYKIGIDNGRDWADTCNTYLPEEEDTTVVFKGSTIYASKDYYGDIEAVYSTECLDDMIPLTIE